MRKPLTRGSGDPGPQDVDRLFLAENEPVGELLIIRHGEPGVIGSTGAEGSIHGLSSSGVAQVERLAKRLTDFPIAGIYCGPETVNRQTADLLSAAIGSAVEVITDLHGEESQGQLPAAVGDARASLSSSRAVGSVSDRRLSAGRASRAFPRRVIGSFERLMALHPGKRIIAVTDRSVVNGYVGSLLCIPYGRFDCGYASVSTVRFLDGLAAVNCVLTISATSIPTPNETPEFGLRLIMTQFLRRITDKRQMAILAK